ncbi:MAG: KamA family radical SAM protein [Candidatus Marinimicrobia bacterium]|nr:KamA family radical SAM protein [Candidatus Neomarinimicrobiota bacterium]
MLNYFSATEEDWKDHNWHLKHIIKDKKTLSELVKLEDDEIRGIEAAEKYGIPFQITPHYLTLFNGGGRDRHDRIVRAQVIPGEEYCRNVHRNRTQNINMDFMGEKANSPVPAITRRYPNIVILKPFDSCPQICVYCQRNWEIKEYQSTTVSRKDVDNAVEWIRNNHNITEVLVTGGDPLTLNNDYIHSLLKKLHKIEHVERIRIGTRIPVTIPFRIDDELIHIFRQFNIPGEKELCVVTHIEDALEITPDVIHAVRKIKNAGINVYNQQVFTYYNSFKFKTAFLRKVLKLSGIDPYYLFNTKGKEETIDFRVPIARIEQEQKEEARFLPGLIRTDEPVFNVPKIGKSHLRSWQNHEIIMILPDGRRVYRFYPWESMSLLIEDYLYTDVSICTYLQRLEADGEDPEKYKSIWYYF